MGLDEIRTQICDKLAMHESWQEKLSDTTPAHYGVEDWDVSISKDCVYVDIPTGTFTFKKVDFTARLLLGSSKEKDGIEHRFSEIAEGKGSFVFTNKETVDIVSVDIKVNLDLYKNE